jgi:hypothetical protein
MLDQHDADPDQGSDPDNLDSHNLNGTYSSQQYDSAHPTPGQGFGYQQSTQSAQMPPPGQQQMTPQYEQQQQQQHLSQGHQQQSNENESGAYTSIPHMIDPNDPMLDADPFGLSASMHYPTSYSFDQGTGGRWLFFLELLRIKKKVIIPVHGGLAQKASVCLLRGRKKKHVGCIIDGETMEVQHKSYRSEGARIEGIGVCLGWFWASRTVVYIA